MSVLKSYSVESFNELEGFYFKYWKSIDFFVSFWAELLIQCTDSVHRAFLSWTPVPGAPFLSSQVF